jgi:pimeloyl-ACP methyl ester carboxylesterase
MWQLNHVNINRELANQFPEIWSRLLLTEPGSRNVELYPAFCGADVDFIIGGRVPAIPDFRPRLKNLQLPLLVLAGRYDRALYPYLQLEFREFAPTARFKILERSGSFGHVEEESSGGIRAPRGPAKLSHCISDLQQETECPCEGA